MIWRLLPVKPDDKLDLFQELLEFFRVCELKRDRAGLVLPESELYTLRALVCDDQMRAFKQEDNLRSLAFLHAFVGLDGDLPQIGVH